METEVKEKSYTKLGFNREEADELVETLNQLLCNYAVIYQKIRNFHWNVVGGDFLMYTKSSKKNTLPQQNISIPLLNVFGFSAINRLVRWPNT